MGDAERTSDMRTRRRASYREITVSVCFSQASRSSSFGLHSILPRVLAKGQKPGITGVGVGEGRQGKQRKMAAMNF